MKYRNLKDIEKIYLLNMKDKILKSFRVTKETYDRMQSYIPGYLSMSSWIESLILKELERIDAEHKKEK